jgi:hypothetical protein
MKKIIVTTTINPVTEAIEAYDNMDGWELIVTGDLKTPKDYKLTNGLYVGPEDQVKINPALSDAIGWNVIQRRNFAFLLAYQHGADIVAIIDDDNIPLPNWGKNIMVGQEVECKYYTTDQLCFDPVGVTNHPNLWHRGFPLELLSKRNYDQYEIKTIVPDIQADFWNGDPDIDAICRMEHAPDCNFDPVYFPMASNRISPFNSQNTFMSRHVLRDYFLFPFVGRMDDIWISYYIQALGHKVIYGEPTVVQKRNDHNLMVDFNKEVVGYQNNLELIKGLYQDPESIKQHLPGRVVYAWDLYRKHLKEIT